MSPSFIGNTLMIFGYVFLLNAIWLIRKGRDWEAIFSSTLGMIFNFIAFMIFISILSE
jgi:hypothetical protein